MSKDLLMVARMRDMVRGRLVQQVRLAAGLTLAARAVFYRGLRRYESGNLVTVRG